MNAQFKMGDVVILRSGGPRMTVDESYPGGMIRCAWFLDGELRVNGFYPDMLLKCDLEEKAA